MDVRQVRALMSINLLSFHSLAGTDVLKSQHIIGALGSLNRSVELVTMSYGFYAQEYPSNLTERELLKFP